MNYHSPMQNSEFFKKTRFKVLKSIYFHFKTATKQMLVFFDQKLWSLIFDIVVLDFIFISKFSTYYLFLVAHCKFLLISNLCGGQWQLCKIVDYPLHFYVYTQYIKDSKFLFLGILSFLPLCMCLCSKWYEYLVLPNGIYSHLFLLDKTVRCP